MEHGGVRSGAGRKSRAVEENTKNLCLAAIVLKYKTPEEGLKSLLESGEPSLIKFVFEHAYGKPVEKIEQSGAMGITINHSVVSVDQAKKQD